MIRIENHDKKLIEGLVNDFLINTPLLLLAVESNAEGLLYLPTNYSEMRSPEEHLLRRNWTLYCMLHLMLVS